MNRFRLRGTWEEDPAPIPFPTDRAGAPAGRSAGRDDDRTETRAEAETDRGMTTDEVVDAVESELDRLTLRIDDLRRLVSPFEDGDEPDPAA